MTIPASSLVPTNKVFFSVQVLDNLDGKQLKALRPDENGYYDVVLAMLDATSRNNAYYDVPSLLHEINDASTVFNMSITEGNLRGEYGHPSEDSSLNRIAEVNQDRVSHHIRKIWTGERTERGIPLYGKIRPSGPYGKLLEDSLLNPMENTTFSLRCLMTQKPDPANKRLYRTVKRLVTFDYVLMPGYREASKWYAPAKESFGTGREYFENGFCVEIRPDQIFTNEGKIVGLESWSDKELSDLFGIKEVELKGIRMNAYRTGTGTYYDDKGTKRSAMHAMLRTGRKG